MTPAAGVARASRVGTFDILEDEALISLGSPSPRHHRHHHQPDSSARDALEEISIAHRQNKAYSTSPVELCKPTETVEAIPPSADLRLQNKPAWRAASRNRRPPIESETFEPLDAVIEEPSSLQESDTPETPQVERAHGLTRQRVAQGEIQHRAEVWRIADAVQAETSNQKIHPLAALDSDPNIQEQVEKHLAGEYEWLLTHPVPERLAENHESTPNGSVVQIPPGSTVYGCTFLRRTSHSRPAGDGNSGPAFTNGYALLASPLSADAYVVLGEMDGSEQGVVVSLTEPPPYPGGPLKVPEVVTMVEQVLPPSPSIISDRSGSIAGSSRAGSFSLPRIEDSLEELDKLEEELEAVNEAALSRPVPAIKDAVEPAKASPKTPSTARGTPVPLERSTVAAKSATVRVKRTVTTRPSLRRVASLTLREKKADEPEPVVELKAAGPLTTRAKSGTTRAVPAAAKTPVKSAKAPTVPKFELPGEAVARRLKEQRDAREAKQAEAKKPQAVSTRCRINRPLAKPTFELPGEAISRRKREEREAKLKAEAEEERKKREFKARPVRHSIGPATLPRATLASLARQNKTLQDDAEEKRAETVRLKRMSMGMVRPAAAPSPCTQSSPQARGRDPTAAASETASRTTSASTGRSKRSTLSAGELEQQRLRGKEILARDSTLAKDKERDRREREAKAKTAREQAAERSRIASREWAEKKRRREEAAAKAKEA
ncbi:carboxylesterase family protein [Purpureocillium lavendulum]|uniref:Carboxylesterase family protein n=1 Tax=Purpureocillium lavendulum TaxID=1247861 RepID=A0AB34FK64_9HYPO|nr:carboxylesterase family protein [Purpureocillium lavendulum]